MSAWALVFAMAFLNDAGTAGIASKVESVYESKKDCEATKALLDKNSKEAVAKREVNENIKSFGAVCVEVPLNIHNQPKGQKGA